MATVPRNVSELRVYLADDSNVYAVNTVNGLVYMLRSGTPAAPIAPAGTWIAADGHTQLGPSGVTLNSTNGPSTLQFYPGFGTIQVTNPDGTSMVIHSSYIAIYTPGPYMTVACDGSTPTPSVALNLNGNLLRLATNKDGDLIVYGSGANAGKSVNLTFGKWT